MEETPKPQLDKVITANIRAIIDAAQSYGINVNNDPFDKWYGIIDHHVSIISEEAARDKAVELILGQFGFSLPATNGEGGVCALNDTMPCPE